MSDTLLARIHPRSTRDHRDDVLDLLSESLFRRTAGLSHSERIDLLYRRLRRLDTWDRFTEEPKDDDWRYHALMEQVVLVDPALWLAGVVHFSVSQGAMKRFSELPDVRSLVRRLKSRGEVAVILITELGHARSGTMNRTVARFDPASREFRLSTPDVGATKIWSNTAAPGVAKVAVVAAELVDADDRRCGRFFFVVPLRDAQTVRPGISLVAADEDSPAGLDVGLVTFDDVRVPYGYWLRGSASLDSSGVFTEPSPEERVERYIASVESMWIEMPRALASVARAASTIAVRFTTVRDVPDPAGRSTRTIEFRPVQEAVLGALVSALALTFLVNSDAQDERAGTMTERAGGNPVNSWTAFKNDLGLLKIIACRTAEDVVRKSRERCGALGLLSGNRFVDYEAFTQRARNIGGDNHLLSLDIARSLLATRGATTTTVGDAGRNLAGEVAGDPGDLASWLELARRREQSLLDAVELTADTHVSNDSLSLAASAVTARGERLLLEAFAREVALSRESGDASASRLLESCALLFAVDVIGADSGSLADTRMRQIRYRCHDAILPELDRLIAALDVPQDLVGAPLMCADYPSAILDAEPRSASPSRQGER
jgi:acyl-CoA oxidase